MGDTASERTFGRGPRVRAAALVRASPTPCGAPFPSPPREQAFKAENPQPAKPSIKPEVLEEIRGMFEVYDADANGVLDQAELYDALSSAGYEEEQIQATFAECFTAGKHHITFDEVRSPGGARERIRRRRSSPFA